MQCNDSQQKTQVHRSQGLNRMITITCLISTLTRGVLVIHRIGTLFGGTGVFRRPKRSRGVPRCTKLPFTRVKRHLAAIPATRGTSTHTLVSSAGPLLRSPCLRTRTWQPRIPRGTTAAGPHRGGGAAYHARANSRHVGRGFFMIISSLVAWNQRVHGKGLGSGSWSGHCTAVVFEPWNELVSTIPAAALES